MQGKESTCKCQGADSGYNGWKNYETWAVGMYLDGNYTGQGTYQYAIETVQEILALDHPTSEYWTPEQSWRYNVATALQELVESDTMGECTGDTDTPNVIHPLVSDLLGAALSSVDWNELADAWIENVKEQSDAT